MVWCAVVCVCVRVCVCVCVVCVCARVCVQDENVEDEAHPERAKEDEACEQSPNLTQTNEKSRSFVCDEWFAYGRTRMWQSPGTS